MTNSNGRNIAIVTGSALGLGYELTKRLIANGWFVAGIDFNESRQLELSKEFPADAYRGFVGDVSDEIFVKRAIADIAATGHIDLLINNVGQPSFKTPTAYEASDVDRCFKGLKGTSMKVVGVYPGGIDTAFYRDSRDYVSEEKQHTFMDPGELARVILFNLVNDANLTVSDILIERNCR